MWLGSDVAAAVALLVAVALIGPLAWEPPYGMGVALKKKKKKIRVIHFYFIRNTTK